MTAAGLCVCLASELAAQPAPGSPRSVAAEFLRRLGGPGTAHELRRPAAMHFDPHSGEILVAESGNGRIVIFDREGVYLYEFGSGGHYGVALDLAVDSEGLIYVLGSTRHHPAVFVYDFDGEFLGPLAGVATDRGGGELDACALAMDAQDNLYLLDRSAIRICSYTRDGRPRLEFPLFGDLSERERQEHVTGMIKISGQRLYVPAPVAGSVYVYDLEGRLERTVGYRGSNIGELSFPVDVALDSRGRAYVLDRNRFNIVCYGPDGKFLGEFGGRGVSPGWFYYPTLLETTGDGRVCVGQVFQNAVQMCSVPAFILDQGNDADPDTDPGSGLPPEVSALSDPSMDLLE